MRIRYIRTLKIDDGQIMANRFDLPGEKVFVQAYVLSNGNRLCMGFNCAPDGSGCGYMEKHGLNKSELATFNKDQYATDFYLKTVVPAVSMHQLLSGKWENKLVFTSEIGLKELNELRLNVDTLHRFVDFGVQNLDFKFLNYKTRERALSRNYLLRIRRPVRLDSGQPSALSNIGN